jgi:hypothetical protein
MKRTLFLSILIVFFTTSLMSIVGCNNQTSTKEQLKEDKEQFELQEKCGGISREFFKNEFSRETSYYRNHYNKKMNKCFILVTGLYTTFKSLNDVNENKRYGVLLITKDGIGCDVLEKKCKSEQEWDSLVKPYMEE